MLQLQHLLLLLLAHNWMLITTREDFHAIGEFYFH